MCDLFLAIGVNEEVELWASRPRKPCHDSLPVSSTFREILSENSLWICRDAEWQPTMHAGMNVRKLPRQRPLRPIDWVWVCRPGTSGTNTSVVIGVVDIILALVYVLVAPVQVVARFIDLCLKVFAGFENGTRTSQWCLIPRTIDSSEAVVGVVDSRSKPYVRPLLCQNNKWQNTCTSAQKRQSKIPAIQDFLQRSAIGPSSDSPVFSSNAEGETLQSPCFESNQQQHNPESLAFQQQFVCCNSSTCEHRAHGSETLCETNTLPEDFSSSPYRFHNATRVGAGRRRSGP